MKNSLMYGIPAGLAVVIFYLAFYLANFNLFLVCSAIFSVAYILSSLIRIRSNNRAYFPFRFAWMSAFTISFIAAFTSGFGVFLFWLDFAEAEAWEMLGALPSGKDKKILSSMLAFENFSLIFSFFVLSGTGASFFVKRKS